MFTLMKNGAKAIALYNHYQVINDTFQFLACFTQRTVESPKYLLK